jgi:hypothetical protein
VAARGTKARHARLTQQQALLNATLALQAVVEEIRDVSPSGSCPACDGTGDITCTQAATKRQLVKLEELASNTCPVCNGVGLLDGGYDSEGK